MVGAAVPQLRRRERRKQEVRTRILQAALELFDENGFEATKVQEICERADVVYKTFFNHFPTKQHLLREVAEQQLATLLETIRSACEASGSTRERLTGFFERIAENVAAAGPMRRELVTEIMHATQGSGEGSMQSRLLHDAFAGLIREGRARGDVRMNHLLSAQTDVVLGTFYALILSWAHDESYALRRRALAAARLLADALCGPQGAKRP